MYVVYMIQFEKFQKRTCRSNAIHMMIGIRYLNGKTTWKVIKPSNKYHNLIGTKIFVNIKQNFVGLETVACYLNGRIYG